jgi:uncharacterized repeat protein (TIGR03803 family)
MLYSFGQSGDGQLPYGPLVGDANGVLYGTTSSGGSHNSGTVFSLTPPAAGESSWTETQLLSFDGATGGAQPLTGVVFGANGVLYGTTSAGGAGGAGIAFSLTPPKRPGHAWTEAVLYSFTGGTDGYAPNYGPLLIGNNGVLYGMTSGGGANGAGAAFSLTPGNPGAAWTENILWSFGASITDGTNPEGGLASDANGVLYGVTSAGGAPGYGVVFSLTPPAGGTGGWTEAVLYSFLDEPDGTTPMGNLLIGAGGVLYGVTSFGGGNNAEGTAFSLTPPVAPGGLWLKDILYRFSIVGTRQFNPRSGFVVSNQGTMYVTTCLGGLGPDGGVVSLKPPKIPGDKWGQAWLFHFIGTDGNNPAGGLLYLKNTLYGTTYTGGEQNFGVVYSWKF